MSSNLQTIRALIYYNGRKVIGRHGVTFEGEKRQMRITRGTTFEGLKANIHHKLGLLRNQHISEITVRALAGSSEYTAISITDDDDVDIILDIFVEQAETSTDQTHARKFVEIYVDIQNTDDLSLPIQSVDVNTTPHIDILNKNASSSVLPVVPNAAILDDEDIPTYYQNDDEPEEEEDEDACLAAENNDDESNSEDDDDVPMRCHNNVNETTSSIVGYENVVEGNNVTPNVGPNISPFWNGIPHFSYINYEYPNEDREYNEREYRGAWTIGDELSLKQEFDYKESMQMAVKSYCMKINKEVVVVESTTMKLVLRCKDHGSGCPWQMRAMKPKNGLMWVVSRWEGPHNCVTCNLSQDHRQLDSAFIASTILDLVKEEPHVSIGLIQERIRNNYGFTISYRKAWKAKQKAMAKIYGNWDQSYAYLPRWFNYMLTFLEGSVYHIQTNDYVVNHRVVNGYRVFHRVFWTFKQCCDAFNFCKPVIQVDGTHLYGKYKGTLLIATTQDGNDEVLPLAFAVVEGICLISDRHCGILSAVANPHLDWQPPKAYHVFCLRHVGSNFNQRFKNEEWKRQLKNLGYTPSKVNFDVKLEEFRSNSPEVATWIDSIPKEKWSRAYDVDGRRYGHMTTNLSECVNSIFKGARGMPITSMVKHTYSKLVHYFVKRGHEASLDADAGIKFCHNANRRMEREAIAALSHIVRAFNRESTLFEVEEPYNPITQKGGYSLSLYLNERKCQCGKFQAFKYPCSHVRAVCLKMGMTYDNFVDPCYSIHNINKVYASPWFPIGNEEAIPPYNGSILLPDANRVRAKGRPKRTRIHNEMDHIESSSSRSKCGVCGRIGHNRWSCPARLNVQ
ncbi:uncharacterized protein LOC133314212 [Gastrolobium bilobum]|uniref:uncharacterized protein LOC133314212 n=1 Tax=Gastrolobium bilobum TaxID=150636 RepID=UPI002AB27C8E|nr:uncharacterized protein LOC133314212 [Gastrolobium bilobum]